MKSKLLGCLSATVLGAAIALATPAMAQRGGGGFGGMHGGFGGGMHFGGGGFGGGGFRGGTVTGRSVFVPGGNRFAGAPFAAQVNNTFPFVLWCSVCRGRCGVRGLVLAPAMDPLRLAVDERLL
jgi:hypothetical protein